MDDAVWAGEYPVWEWDQSARARQLRLFTDFGIDCFVDLTEQGDMPPYAPLLAADRVRYSLPVPNRGVPASVRDVVELFRTIGRQLAERPSTKVYIHCVGGVGRTGTIVACYYVYFKGLGADNALALMRQRFATHGRAAWMSAPETAEQVDFVRVFAETFFAQE